MGISEAEVEVLVDKAVEFYGLGEEVVRSSQLARATEEDEEAEPIVTPGIAVAALPRVRDGLEDRGHLVHLVSEPYFERAKRDDLPPATREEALKCLPIGYGKQATGIRRVPQDKENDLLWLTWQGLGMRQAGGKAESVTTRMAEAIEGGRITPDELVKRITAYARKLNEGKKLPSHLRDELIPRLFGESEAKEARDERPAIAAGAEKKEPDEEEDSD